MRLSFSAQSFPAPRHEHVLGKDDIARVDSDHLSTLLLHSSMRPRVVTPKLQRQQIWVHGFPTCYICARSHLDDPIRPVEGYVGERPDSIITD